MSKVKVKGLSKADEKRLALTLKFTCGTMPITIVVQSKEEAVMFEKAKKGRKWANLVDIRSEGG